MKRLSNEFDEWDREIDRLKGLGLDDQSRLYKNLSKQDRNEKLKEWLAVAVLWGGIVALMALIDSMTAFG
jgi:hypothetical protein